MKHTLLITMAVALLLLAGCSSQTAAADKVHSGEVTVEMKNMKYVPAKLTVKAGTKVVFTNRDVMPHDVVQIAVKELTKSDPGFTSPVVGMGESWSHTFDKPGEYPILCVQSAHFTAGMVGTITVLP